MGSCIYPYNFSVVQEINKTLRYKSVPWDFEIQMVTQINLRILGSSTISKFGRFCKLIFSLRLIFTIMLKWRDAPKSLMKNGLRNISFEDFQLSITSYSKCCGDRG